MVGFNLGYPMLPLYPFNGGAHSLHFLKLNFHLSHGGLQCKQSKVEFTFFPYKLEVHISPSVLYISAPLHERKSKCMNWKEMIGRGCNSHDTDIHLSSK